MSDWSGVLLHLALQHLWQSASLLGAAWLLWRMPSLGAGVLAKLMTGLFFFASLLPGAALLPATATPAPIAHGSISPHSTDAPGRVSDDVGKPGVRLAHTEPAHVQTLSILIVMVWFGGAAWSLRGVAEGWRQARRLRSGARRWVGAQDMPWISLPVCLSDAVAGPMVVGLRHPCVLLPTELAQWLPEPALQAVLRHELAHVQRGDLWMLLTQRLCLAVYWWNPLLRRLAAHLELAREMACDAIAATAVGSGQRCADALLATAELRERGPSCSALATRMHVTEAGLVRRVNALLCVPVAMRRRRTRAAISIVLFSAVIAGMALATPRTTVTISANHRATQLISAAAAGDVSTVERLISGGVDINTVVLDDDASGTALINAARIGDLRMVDTLLALGADPNAAALRDGNPLIVAAMNGHIQVMRRLVAAGADVNAVVRYDETPLINAAREGHLAAVRYLVEQGADISLGVWAEADRWRSPLNQAHGVAVIAYLRQQDAVAGPPGRH